MEISEKANKHASDILHQIRLARERELLEQLKILEEDNAILAAYILKMTQADNTEYEIRNGRFCPLA